MQAGQTPSLPPQSTSHPELLGADEAEEPTPSTPPSALQGKARQPGAALALPLPSYSHGWCEPGAQPVSHTLAPFTVLNGPQRPGVCLGGRPSCHLARTRGGNRPFIRLGLDTIHFIFPTAENRIKAAPVQRREEEGRRRQPPPGPTHHPHLRQAAVLAHGGWAGSWGGWGLDHISWHASHLGTEQAQGGNQSRTQTPANSPSSLGEQACMPPLPHPSHSLGPCRQQPGGGSTPLPAGGCPGQGRLGSRLTLLHCF